MSRRLPLSARLVCDHRHVRRRPAMTTLTLTDTSPADIAADALVVATVRGTDGAGPRRRARPATQGGRAPRGGARGPRGDRRPRRGRPGRLGPRRHGDIGRPHRARRRHRPRGGIRPGVLPAAAGAALRSLAEQAARWRSPCRRPTRPGLGAVADGAYAGCYRFTAHKSLDHRRRRTGQGRRSRGPTSSSPSAMTGAEATAARRAGRRPGAGPATSLATSSTPPEPPRPADLRRRGPRRVTASAGRVTLAVLDEKALAKGGFGGIVGVGQGSVHPPRIVTHDLQAGPRQGAASPWSARASPSTPAACASSRRPAC